MARICDRCGRGPLRAVSRSHSNIATKRRQFLNLQMKRVEGHRMRICTNCLKTLAKKPKATA
ncbi:MAG: 50S ribosomal protein L28 [Patescibacteria group bacterium]